MYGRDGDQQVRKPLMTISPEHIARMNASADKLGAHFAKEDNREVMRLQLDMVRRVWSTIPDKSS
jgi:hypothetical protein